LGQKFISEFEREVLVGAVEARNDVVLKCMNGMFSGILMMHLGIGEEQAVSPHCCMS
jgi:hypothetical protein